MSADTFVESANIIVQENCFAVMFTNIGDTIARVNNMIVYPGVPGTSLGDSRTIGGHVLDIYKGNITLSFDVGGANPHIEIVQLYYLDAAINPRA